MSVPPFRFCRHIHRLYGIEFGLNSLLAVRQPTIYQRESSMSQQQPPNASACKRKEPFFYRVYSGERLCKKCFAESIEDKVRATIVKYKMLSYNDHVAVAVSGGKDSISLLEVLAKMERKYPRATLVAVTVDEGIKGYRDEALEITEENLQTAAHPASCGQLQATLRLHIRRDC